MIVKILDYGEENNQKFIEYGVLGLTLNQMEFLNENLEEKTAIDDDTFKLKMYFSRELYPFQSDVAKYRLDDFMAREEIEMNIFLSSFLDDM
ncbi:DUF5750 family protein [Methanobrevibacter sp.]|uniref:DUF5750 family protein n=1 Tax=Methanobrevibacter sp. TaxID=66852 RepID=UPI0025DC1F7B|nr:DUF5750 family protein [Methanobrevibacter sp.]MBR4447539.1 hypothetical protein [Methanobrevibacter sp.]